MRFPALVLAVTALLFLNANPVRAQRPDFAGTWVMDRAQSASAGQAEAIGPVTLVIRVTPSELIVERTQSTNKRTIHYRADGGDTQSTLEMGSATGRLRWDGPRLITETVYDVQGIPINVKATHSLSSDGRELTVQSEL
ncbi:MAG: hypothetical protein JO256_13640, partial [Alphaproteobacteria bacterium]|nr:hypothetical protein [Alphaproteobacteria bacterium]